MDPKQSWSRRRFLGATADAAVLGTLAGALKPLVALASPGEAALTLYDPRFDAAPALARALAGSANLLAMGGDPTALIARLLETTPGRRPAQLQGVTTESVPFCLQQLFPAARLTQRRADRDLFVWTLQGIT